MSLSGTQLNTDLGNLIADLTGVTMRFGGNVYSCNVEEEEATENANDTGSAYYVEQGIRVNYQISDFATNFEDPPAKGDTITLIEGGEETDYRVTQIIKSADRIQHTAILEVPS